VTTYNLRWATFGPSALMSSEFRAAIYPVLAENGLTITSESRVVTPITLNVATFVDPETGAESIEAVVRSGLFAGWQPVVPDESVLRQIRTITGFSWQVSGRTIADDTARRRLQRAMNAALGDRLEPQGYYGYGPGVHVRGLREPDPTYAMLDRWWMLRAIAGFAMLGMATVTRHA
jgi:hypothetical protein